MNCRGKLRQKKLKLIARTLRAKRRAQKKLTPRAKRLANALTREVENAKANVNTSE